MQFASIKTLFLLITFQIMMITSTGFSSIQEMLLVSIKAHPRVRYHPCQGMSRCPLPVSKRACTHLTPHGHYKSLPTNQERSHPHSLPQASTPRTVAGTLHYTTHTQASPRIQEKEREAARQEWRKAAPALRPPRPAGAASGPRHRRSPPGAAAAGADSGGWCGGCGGRGGRRCARRQPGRRLRRCAVASTTR